ncbi:dTDP-4-amino-4,6-dideoxyglucose formyltransferase [Nostoc sp. XA010]|uniref:dTDP-4-amino-4,6-dideoxyglucose formyltransferase n=1 Tax=Nostoc sp. XA010 TaxID=2780407 RepID=UPI001E4E2E76|nr:dTDP-4-amino-4,6-dideoxyglucose formyltransferase [Nostoc sp. XA010]MCC5660047.1 dTDP-4-amino-4,6-dideoxyglucose formyltransferase [Nostoc sp. XA010]
MNLFYKNNLIIGDNSNLLKRIFEILEEKHLNQYAEFSYVCSPQTDIELPFISDFKCNQIDVNKDIKTLVDKFDLIISAHCKQIFPAELVTKVKCINIHPGFNPYNRGWYPHVFSIINKFPTGATIHEMDQKIDHGSIIIQRQVEIFSYDTSDTVYKRILDTELDIFSETIEKILYNDYHTYTLQEEGNINKKKDFQKIRQIKLEKVYSGREIIDLLRALTHGDYQNAYFIDDENNKIFIRLTLEPEEVVKE